MAGASFRLIRVTPSASASPSPVSAFGGTYSNGGSGSTLDVPPSVAQVLAANGWIQKFHVGTTANRPAPSDTDWTGGLLWQGMFLLHYFDTSLGILLRWDPTSATSWRNALTDAAA